MRALTTARTTRVRVEAAPANSFGTCSRGTSIQLLHRGSTAADCRDQAVLWTSASQDENLLAESTAVLDTGSVERTRQLQTETDCSWRRTHKVTRKMAEEDRLAKVSGDGSPDEFSPE